VSIPLQSFHFARSYFVRSRVIMHHRLAPNVTVFAHSGLSRVITYHRRHSLQHIVQEPACPVWHPAAWCRERDWWSKIYACVTPGMVIADSGSPGMQQIFAWNQATLRCLLLSRVASPASSRNLRQKDIRGLAEARNWHASWWSRG
jgi:hypothetical protein